MWIQDKKALYNPPDSISFFLTIQYKNDGFHSVSHEYVFVFIFNPFMRMSAPWGQGQYYVTGTMLGSGAKTQQESRKS